MSKPRLLDLFAGAGGCAMGYSWAGFDVCLGIDIKPQKKYPFDFLQWDALDYLSKYGHEYDFIHASPPCQKYSEMRRMSKKNYLDLISETRNILLGLRLPYTIENVMNAPLRDTIHLRGDMFKGLLVKRDRLFECNFTIKTPAIPTKKLHIPHAGKGASPVTGFVTIVGTGSLGKGLTIDYARNAMGISWMSKPELSQSIPPAFTQYIGAEWLRLNHFEFCHPELIVPFQLNFFDA